MKLSFTAKIRFVILLLLLISLLQNIILLQLIPSDLPNKVDLQNTIYISTFIQLFFVIILFSYIPILLQKAFNEINQVLKDVTQGIYKIDLDVEEYEKRADKEFFSVFSTLAAMVKSVAKFDLLKKEKIVEHHNRILAILNLTEDGIMVIDSKGTIVYKNDILLDVFPEIREKNSIIDSNFTPEIENNIKKYAINVIKKGSKQPPINHFFHSLKKHVTIKSAIVRDSGGNICGAVLALSNLPNIDEKKKDNKKSDEEQSKPEKQENAE